MIKLLSCAHRARAVGGTREHVQSGLRVMYRKARAHVSLVTACGRGCRMQTLPSLHYDCNRVLRELLPVAIFISKK